VEENTASVASRLDLVVAAFTAGWLREDRPSSRASICPRVSWRSSSALAWRGEEERRKAEKRVERSGGGEKRIIARQ